MCPVEFPQVGFLSSPLRGPSETAGVQAGCKAGEASLLMQLEGKRGSSQCMGQNGNKSHTVI